MVISLFFQVAVTPVGKNEAVPIPVAPVVARVMAVGIAMSKHTVGKAEAGPAVLLGVTLIVPVANPTPHPPVRGIL
jgi:hypothetical protein